MDRFRIVEITTEENQEIAVTASLLPAVQSCDALLVSPKQLQEYRERENPVIEVCGNAKLTQDRPEGLIKPPSAGLWYVVIGRFEASRIEAKIKL